ncbi:MAG TPA: chemotaxis protein CheB [Thermoanaerobaculia bacterium]|nr:chemotaxis protein CheB [Thermoanaerobaculia bacterium]
MATRDIVVLGASAGGVEPLRAIAREMHPQLPASVFVVLHLAPDNPSALAEILDRAGPLPAIAPEDEQTIEHGKIYVASPDKHLFVEDGHVRVLQGPKENRQRPSIDVLFRSAARVYGPRVIGVVLSGALDDGTAGLIAVKIRGGLAVVQEPADAFSADMPRNAMRYLDPDYVLTAQEIGVVLNRLVLEHVLPEDSEPPSETMVEEDDIARIDPQTILRDDRPGVQSVIACPDCHGVLWEIQEGGLLRFRCRTGHAYSPETLISAENEQIEKALWEALRTLEERVALRRRLVRQAEERRLTALAAHFRERLKEAEALAETLRDALLHGTRPEAVLGR